MHSSKRSTTYKVAMKPSFLELWMQSFERVTEATEKTESQEGKVTVIRDAHAGEWTLISEAFVRWWKWESNYSQNWLHIRLPQRAVQNLNAQVEPQPRISGDNEDSVFVKKFLWWFTKYCQGWESLTLLSTVNSYISCWILENKEPLLSFPWGLVMEL